MFVVVKEHIFSGIQLGLFCLILSVNCVAALILAVQHSTFP